MESSKPTLLAVSNAIQDLTVEETRQLAFQLGVKLNVLDDVVAQYEGENRKQHFVQKLLAVKTDISWGKIVTGLRKIDMNSLAEDIERTHPPKRVNSESLPPCETTANIPVVQSDAASTSPPSPAATDSVAPAVVSLSPHKMKTLTVCPQKVSQVEERIECLKETFFELKSDARQLLSKREEQECQFLDKFRDYLLDLPVARKVIHIKFLKQNEDEILEAKNIHKLFAILGRYCNYSNYEIIFHIVKKFCKGLMQRMLSYRDLLIDFEKETAVDVYLCAISAYPQGKIYQAFLRMTMKTDKPASLCTLYEIRQLKELIAENSSVESYAMYIEEPQEGSVNVVLHVPVGVGGMVGVVVMDPHFRQKTLLTDATVDGTDLSTYLVRLWPQK